MKTFKIGIGTLALSLVLALVCAPVDASAQVKTHQETFTEAKDGTRPNLWNSRIAFSRVTWYFRGAVTSCSFKIERAELGTVWEDLLAVQDCSAEGKIEFVTAPLHAIIRFVVTEFTGDGEVTFYWEGFTGEKCGKEYQGALSKETSLDPAPGQELSVTIPARERWRIHSALFKLQTTSSAVDREVFLSVSVGGDEIFRTFADGVVKANQEGIFTTANLGFVGTIGLGPSSLNQPADERTVMIPVSDIFIPGGYKLETETFGIQAGDDYSSAIVVAEKCPN